MPTAQGTGDVQGAALAEREKGAQFTYGSIGSLWG